MNRGQTRDRPPFRSALGRRPLEHDVGRCGHRRFRQVDNAAGTLCDVVSMPTTCSLPIPPSSVTIGVSTDVNPGKRGSNSGIA
jgi:hypothetical protein